MELKELTMSVVKLIRWFLPGFFIISSLEINASSSIKFAVIGDYGEYDNISASPHHSSIAVATLVKTWGPDFIITTNWLLVFSSVSWIF